MSFDTQAEATMSRPERWLVRILELRGGQGGLHAVFFPGDGASLRIVLDWMEGLKAIEGFELPAGGRFPLGSRVYQARTLKVDSPGQLRKVRDPERVLTLTNGIRPWQALEVDPISDMFGPELDMVMHAAATYLLFHLPGKTDPFCHLDTSDMRLLLPDVLEELADIKEQS